MKRKSDNVLRYFCDEDSSNAGWYVQTTQVPEDMIPEWREPGNGISGAALTRDFEAARTKALEKVRMIKRRCSETIEILEDINPRKV